MQFLWRAIKYLSLSSVTAIQGRAEDIGRDPVHREQYHVVTARAVAALGVLAEYCLPLVRIGGFFLAMKGPKWEEELSSGRSVIERLGGEIKKVAHMQLPFNGGERNLLLVEKVKPTSIQYPRRPGIPLKKPLL